MFKWIEWFFEAVGWLRIVLSPFLVGIGLGSIVYLSNPTQIGIAIGIAVASLGLIVGILWANKVWKSKKGTISFLSRLMATPELNKKEVQDKE